jgi:RNA-splicing ligase RtcB
MEPVTTISAILSSVKTATDIAKLIKDSNTSLEEAEVKLKMADLISTLADIKIELSEVQISQRTKEEKILELEKLLSKKEKVTFNNGVYWMEGDEVPFCQVCFEKDAKYHHLRSGFNSNRSPIYHCMICNNKYLK